jgi:hypothetical protein
MADLGNTIATILSILATAAGIIGGFFIWGKTISESRKAKAEAKKAEAEAEKIKAETNGHRADITTEQLQQIRDLLEELRIERKEHAKTQEELDKLRAKCTCGAFDKEKKE